MQREIENAAICVCGHSAYWHNQLGAYECEAGDGCACRALTFDRPLTPLRAVQFGNEAA
jgi:hypothetical protein